MFFPLQISHGLSCSTKVSQGWILASRSFVPNDNVGFSPPIEIQSSRVLNVFSIAIEQFTHELAQTNFGSSKLQKQKPCPTCPWGRRGRRPSQDWFFKLQKQKPCSTCSRGHEAVGTPTVEDLSKYQLFRPNYYLSLPIRCDALCLVLLSGHTKRSRMGRPSCVVRWYVVFSSTVLLPPS